MKTKHTPVPWIAQETAKGYKVVDGFGFTISVVEKSKFDKESNAKLIAAAPELLESLNEIMRFKAELKNVMGDALASPDNFLKALNDAEAVIKKATE